MHNELAEEYSKLMSYFEVNDGYNTDVKIKTVLNGMGFPKSQFDRQISGFSGGEKTRLAIAKLLLENPNLLILDEPTNHLDFKTVCWLEDYLKDYRGALLVVSHDRYFLDKVATSICEIERGRLTRYKGNYTAYARLKDDAVARQKKEYELQQKEIAKMEDYVARNIVRASTSKSAQSRVKALEKIERIEKPVEYTKNAKIKFDYAVKPPFDLLTVKNADISVGFGENHKTLAENISFDVKCGDKIAIIGDNGIGKSTLLKMIQGKIPHKGTVRWASNVRISYFEQESSHLNPLNTVMEEIHSRYPIMNEVDIRSLLGQVRITGENVFKKIGVISGGERAKLCFAVMMLEKGNVLILDEPTNHLDLASKEAIEEALNEFDGTVIFVSHDRYLINKIASEVIEITKDGIECFKGGFDNYLAITEKREADKQSEEEQRRRQLEFEKMNDKKVQAYRSKEQRSLEAKKRNRIKQLETEIEELQNRADLLSEEITREEIYTNFEVMNEKCTEIDRLKNLINEKFDEWAELSE
jgi:ATP-binding cassette subfamily F protein 3